MRKKILGLLQQKMTIDQRLSSWKFDSNTVLTRIKLLREKWAIEKELDLYSLEEIFTAINYEQLKRHMEKRRLRKILMIENYEKEEQEERELIEGKLKNMALIELYFIFCTMNRAHYHSFLELGANTTRANKVNFHKKLK